MTVIILKRYIKLAVDHYFCAISSLLQNHVLVCRTIVLKIKNAFAHGSIVIVESIVRVEKTKKDVVRKLFIFKNKIILTKTRWYVQLEI